MPTSGGTIAFAVSVAHAQSIARTFERVGVPAASVDGSMPTRERSAIYRKLALGEILVLSSCEALAEGFDVPSVSAIMLCRPTKSKSKYFQQVGRGLRIADRKTDCLVLDQAGLVRRFGFIEDLKWVNLEEAVEVETGEVPTKACPTHLGGCGGIVRAIAPTCPLCGYGFPQRQKLAPLQELVNFVPEEDKPKFFQYRQWLKEAYQQKLSPGWAASRYRESYRRQFPPLAWSRGAVFGEDPSARQRLEYWRHLRKVAAVKGKTDLWMKHCFHLEFGGMPCPQRLIPNPWRISPQ
ncbi:MAG: hypothetical protein HC925_03360 [Coleofasciculaceae cyanobacterium SM2_3_26]|nr:hypothetical protein [Coleofasciculaceae cyanobacterium SM2_3_26]